MGDLRSGYTRPGTPNFFDQVVDDFLSGRTRVSGPLLWEGGVSNNVGNGFASTASNTTAQQTRGTFNVLAVDSPNIQVPAIIRSVWLISYPSGVTLLNANQLMGVQWDVGGSNGMNLTSTLERVIVGVNSARRYFVAVSDGVTVQTLDTGVDTVVNVDDVIELELSLTVAVGLSLRINGVAVDCSSLTDLPDNVQNHMVAKGTTSGATVGPTVMGAYEFEIL